MQKVLNHIKATPFLKYGHLPPGYAANLVAKPPLSLGPIATKQKQQIDWMLRFK